MGSAARRDVRRDMPGSSRAGHVSAGCTGENADRILIIVLKGGRATDPYYERFREIPMRDCPSTREARSVASFQRKGGGNPHRFKLFSSS